MDRHIFENSTPEIQSAILSVLINTYVHNPNVVRDVVFEEHKGCVPQTQRKMPSKRQIYDCWALYLDYKLNRCVGVNQCMKCCADTETIRAHILARTNGGSDSVKNLHNLCHYCHIESEMLYGEDYFRWFESNSP